MRQTLETFIQALRGAGVPVSIGETMAAFCSAELVGVNNRHVLRNALAVTLAKSPEEKRIFDRCFDAYFDRDGSVPLPGGKDQEAEQAGTDLAESELPEDLAAMLEAGDGIGLAAAMEGAANRIGAANIRFFTQRGLYARRLADEMGLADLEQMIADLRGQQTEAAAARADTLDAGRTALLAQARAFVERQYEIFGVPASQQLRDEILKEARLSALQKGDLARLQRIVRQLAKQMAGRHKRRRKFADRGQLDLRRMLRANMAHGGVPFNIVWRQRKIERPRVVAICDVSRSVAAVAQFMLLFLHSLNDVISDIRSFAFSDRLIEVSDLFETNDFETATAEVMVRIGFRSTDYGRALADLDAGYRDVIDRHTTIIIIGDGRSNYTDPRVDLLRDFGTRAKRLLWLNPEVRPVWGTGDSEMLRYLPHCDLAKTCNTVSHLEAVVDDLLRAYDQRR